MSELLKKLSNITLRDNVDCEVYIKDVTLDTTSKELKEVFNGHEVTNVTIKKSAGGEHAFAFVMFDTPESAASAVAKFNYTELRGKELLMVLCSEKFSFANNTNIFVNNLPKEMTSKDLEEVFADFGEITICKIARMADGTSKGFGYVLFKKEAAAKNAVEKCQNVQIDGNKLTVELYNPTKKTRTDAYSFTNCFCKHFPPKYTEADLRKLLENYGNINSIYFPKKEDGMPVGFACVNFSEPSAAQKAIAELHNKHIFSNKEMGKKEEFTVEPFYMQKNEKKSEREQVLKSLHGSGTIYRARLKKNLFIKNVPNTFPEDDLLKVLNGYGKITDFRLSKDSKNPDKQIGFVCYSTVEEAAIAMQKAPQILLDNQQLELSLYKSKCERNDMFNTGADGYSDEKKIQAKLYDLLLELSNNKGIKENFGVIDAKTNKDFADYFCRKMAGLPIETLKDLCSHSKKLNEHILKILKEKK